MTRVHLRQFESIFRGENTHTHTYIYCNDGEFQVVLIVPRPTAGWLDI